MVGIHTGPTTDLVENHGLVPEPVHRNEGETDQHTMVARTGASVAALSGSAVRGLVLVAYLSEDPMSEAGGLRGLVDQGGALSSGIVLRFVTPGCSSHP